MKHHNIFYGIAVATGMLGYAGLGGAIEYGTGIMTCTVLLAICVISAVVGMREEGVFKWKK